MLILTRQAGEKIRIGADIEVTVVRISNGQIKIGIQAPANVLVLRGELEPHDTKARPARPGG